MKRAWWLACALAGAVSACGPRVPATPVPPLMLVTLNAGATATRTPFQPIPATDTPPPTTTPTASPTASKAPTAIRPTATDTPTPVPDGPAATPAADAPRTLYTLYTTLDYAAHAVSVTEDIRYTNQTGEALTSIVMAVAPNLWPECFKLDLLDQDGAPLANYTLDGQRLTIWLPRPLNAGDTTTFALGFSLSLPSKSGESTFGYRDNQINLTDWYPFIVPFAGDWLLHDPWSFGEYLVYDEADYDVYVLVEDPNVVLAASAPGEANGTSTHFRLAGARTFALSASDSYVVEESAVGPIAIKAYSFAGHEDANSGVVWMATQSLGLYEAKFAPYPYPSLSIVETDLADGQEYDGLVFLASRFYTEYNGTARSNLFTIGTHEVSHQWWFGLVGSDQASEPWLDEALAVYSERIFYQYNYPNYGDWWWNFRVNYFGPTGYVDGGLDSFRTYRDYVNAVYLNGAKMLEELRGRVGDDAFFACLQDYAAAHARGRATSADFFAVLRRHTDEDLSDLMQAYLQGQY